MQWSDIHSSPQAISLHLSPHHHHYYSYYLQVWTAMWAQGPFAKNLAVSDLFDPFLTCFSPVSGPFLTCFSPVRDPFVYDHSICEHLCVSTMCEHPTREHFICEHSITLCVSTLCEHFMCERSMCEHSMWALCVRTLPASFMCEHSLCEHSMCEQHVWGARTFYVWALYVTGYEHSMCEHCMCEHSMCTPCEHSMCQHSISGHSMCDHSIWALYVTTKKTSTSVLGPDVGQHRKVRELPRKIDISFWTGYWSTTKAKNILLWKSRSKASEKTEK